MKKQETDSTCQTIKFETTPEDQEKMRAEGVPDDEIPPVGVRQYRRSRFHISPREAKVKISLYIDGDILEYFRHRAAAPYQTQINNELRRVMENDSQDKASLENEILNNEAFLRALKEKLELV